MASLVVSRSMTATMSISFAFAHIRLAWRAAALTGTSDIGPRGSRHNPYAKWPGRHAGPAERQIDARTPYAKLLLEGSKAECSSSETRLPQDISAAPYARDAA